ncbi:hypothetical protein I4U23_024562 [Adineta vaga]|nr:hypothetical protein I4U23_024562 [Adineta vaga]
MYRGSILCEQYALQASQMTRPSEISIPISASIDPRFSRILTRAANDQERPSRQQVSPANLLHSPSTTTANSNAWLPPSISEEKSNKYRAYAKMKSCFTLAWKNRLIGLLVGLGIAAISTGTAWEFFCRVRPSSSTTATNSACSSLQWERVGVMVAGNGSYGNAANQFGYQIAIYVDPNNAMYIADYNNHRVQQWLPNAVSGTTIAGVSGFLGSNNSLLSYPTAITGDSNGNLYIADSIGIRVWAIGALTSTQLPGSNGLGSVLGLFVDTNKNVYASYTYNCVVRMWTPTSTAGTILAGDQSCGLSTSQLYYPYGFTVDITTNTIGRIIAGSQFSYPTGIALDSNRNLYVTDPNNYRVIKFNRIG